MAMSSGTLNIGVCFFEVDYLTPLQRHRASWYDSIVSGSTWNHDTLTKYDLTTSHLILQGLDHSLFQPSVPPLSIVKRNANARSALGGTSLEGKFVIFSGGKAELRKGQDIIIKGIAPFLQRYPHAILVVAWHNTWSSGVATLDGSHLMTNAPPPSQTIAGAYDFVTWGTRMGVSAAQMIDMGAATQQRIAGVLQRADAAVFTSRAEGGTNVAAMEALSAGVPTILSNNTGHLDLIDGILTHFLYYNGIGIGYSCYCCVCFVI
jgi:glycosyltransferase involved in cell wall biosynthesis